MRRRGGSGPAGGGAAGRGDAPARGGSVLVRSDRRAGPSAVLGASARAVGRVAALPGAAVRAVGRPARRVVLGRGDGPPVVDDPAALAGAEEAARRRGRGSDTAGAPEEAPPPRLGPGRVALVAVALAVPVGGAGVAVLTSDWLAVTEVSVSVTGAGYVTPDAVRSAAGVQPGEPLATVDLERVSDAVGALPEVAEVEAARRWPHRLHLRVTERAAVTAVADGAGSYVLVDGTGTPFRAAPEPPADVPLLAVQQPAPGDPATVAGLAVIDALPRTLLSRVERVEVRDPAAVTFVMRDGARVAWGSAERSQSKATVLQALLPREAEEYDVTAPEVVVTRG